MCKRSDTIANLAKALVGFNGEVKVIEKDSSNPHFKKRYASLDNIIDEIRPILTKHGLSVIQMPGGDGEKFTMTTMLLHESGEWIESDPIVMRPVKNDPQGIGSCATYARRYSLAAFLSLNTGEDDDGDAATHPGAAQGSPNGQPTPTHTHTPSQLSTSPAAASSGGLASEGQTKMLYAKSRLTEWSDFARVNEFLGYEISKFAEVRAADVTKLAQFLDRNKAA